MTNNHSVFLKEMGITEWTSRDTVRPSAEAATPGSSPTVSKDSSTQSASQGIWWFFGAEPQGDTQVMFQNIIRVLGLGKHEWSWKKSTENLSQLVSPDFPVVVVAFGGSVVQKITGERDSLPQLRDTILALNTGNEEEIPVIASFELNQALNNPQEKALLWQDLLMARSVLQNC